MCLVRAKRKLYVCTHPEMVFSVAGSEPYVMEEKNRAATQLSVLDKV